MGIYNYCNPFTDEGVEDELECTKEDVRNILDDWSNDGVDFQSQITRQEAVALSFQLNKIALLSLSENNPKCSVISSQSSSNALCSTFDRKETPSMYLCIRVFKIINLFNY